jgi:protein gp37
VSDRTKIPWAHATLNLWYACTAVSRGCLNCYARRQSPRLGVDFEGPIVYAPAERWDAPLHWRKPRRVFVNSMSDSSVGVGGARAWQCVASYWSGWPSLAIVVPDRYRACGC